MKTKLFFNTMAMAVVMMVLVGCNGNNAPNSPSGNDSDSYSIIDAVCDMYGKSLNKAISIAEDNGISYFHQEGNCATGFDIEPTETEDPSTQLGMCAWDSDVVNFIGYMVRFKGNNGASKISDFVKTIGETREVDDNLLKFSEGKDSNGEEYDDFNKFLQALANANSDVSALWESDKTSLQLNFEAQYSEDGYSYLTFEIGGEY